MSVWLPPTLSFPFSFSFFLWVWVWVVVVCCPLGLPVRATTAVVQSTDPAIEYIGVWERVQQNRTTAYVVSNTTGSKAVYAFAGTTISVFGVILPRDAPGAAQVSEYSVDGGAPTRYTAPGNVTGPMYDVPFFAASGLSAQGQHTLTILNLGDEFILGHFEVTPNPSRVGPSQSEPGPSATTATAAKSSAASALSSNNATLVHVQSTAQSASPQSTSASNSDSNGTPTATDTTALPPIPTATFTTPSTSVLPTASSTPPNSGLAQGRTSTALSKGATIGGGIAGIFGFLLLVGGLCWYGQRRGRRRWQHKHRASSRVSTNSKAPLGIHTATSQVTLGSDPFASDAAARLRPLYIPVGSASDLSVGGGGTQYTPTPTPTSPQRPSRTGYGYGYGYGYQNEKYAYAATDDAPLQPRPPISPVSAPNPSSDNQATQLDTPVQVRRMNADADADADGSRRSADGGVRIAGGPPGQRGVRHDRDESFLDLASRRSVGSTLPPAYYFGGD